MKTLLITNQKGGVGKTTISIHLALQAVSMGLKTLYIDFDGQCNSSDFFRTYLANHPQKFKNVKALSIVDLFSSDEFNHDLTDSDFTIVYSVKYLGDIELNLDSWVKNFNHVKQFFYICIIDTPPSVGIPQIAPMITTDYVLSPIELNAYSINGSADLITTIANVRDNYNQNLKFLGLLPNRVNKNNNHQLALLNQLAQNYGDFLYRDNLMIPERQALSETAYVNLPVWEIKEHSARKVASKVRPIFANIIQQTMEI
mgnify:FL=1